MAISFAVQQLTSAFSVTFGTSLNETKYREDIWDLLLLWMCAGMPMGTMMSSRKPEIALLQITDKSCCCEHWCVFGGCLAVTSVSTGRRSREWTSASLVSPQCS